MLIRIDGAKSGIKKYLVEGQKAGRELSRNELDERVILTGDLDLTHGIIESMNSQGEKYLHITLSFKEDFIPNELLNDIANEFKSFALSAYQQEEYNFYAEAHLPKTKSYLNKATGEIVERKPHIHVVIPKLNLLSHTTLNPFGLTEKHIDYINAFQEHINTQYGLASPKDNLRTCFTRSSEIISRYKGDFFTGHNKQIKEHLFNQILDKKIETYDSFIALLRETGEHQTRNASQHNQYENIKTEGMQKGVNLKEPVFSKAFIELPTNEKMEKLKRDFSTRYHHAISPSQHAEDFTKTLAQWHSVRAEEVKYLNSGSSFYKKYLAADVEERHKLLSEQKERFYSKYQEPLYEHQKHEPAAHTSDVPSIITQDSHPLHEPYTKSSARNADNVVSQLSYDHSERHQIDAIKNRFQPITQHLNAERLLAELSSSHGVIVDKYTVLKSPDGDHIQCGKRQLNAPDFLTQEMHLPWHEAEVILQCSYTRQLQHAPHQLVQQQPDPLLWKAFIKERSNQGKAGRGLEQQKESERHRKLAIKTAYQTVKSQTRHLPRAERAITVRRATEEFRLQKEALDKTIQEERRSLRTPLIEHYRSFLISKAESEPLALAELRRIRSEQSPSSLDDHYITGAGAEQKNEIILWPKKWVHVTDANGDIIYFMNDRQVAIDEGSRIKFVRTDIPAIEVGLSLAQQKFGSTIHLFGSAEFKEKAARLAADCEMNIQFTDNQLNSIYETRRAEVFSEKMQHRELVRTTGHLQQDAKLLPEKVSQNNLFDTPQSEQGRHIER